MITLEHSALKRARVLPKGKLLSQQSAFNHSATAPRIAQQNFTTRAPRKRRAALVERVGFEPTTRRLEVDNPYASALERARDASGCFFLLCLTELPPHTDLHLETRACEVLEESAGFEPAELTFSSLATKRNKPLCHDSVQLETICSSVGESGGI